jgi:hypothetical protein
VRDPLLAAKKVTSDDVNLRAKRLRRAAAKLPLYDAHGVLSIGPRSIVVFVAERVDVEAGMVYGSLPEYGSTEACLPFKNLARSRRQGLEMLKVLRRTSKKALACEVLSVDELSETGVADLAMAFEDHHHHGDDSDDDPSEEGDDGAGGGGMVHGPRFSVTLGHVRITPEEEKEALNRWQAMSRACSIIDAAAAKAHLDGKKSGFGGGSDEEGCELGPVLFAARKVWVWQALAAVKTHLELMAERTVEGDSCDGGDEAGEDGAGNKEGVGKTTSSSESADGTVIEASASASVVAAGSTFPLCKTASHPMAPSDGSHYYISFTCNECGGQGYGMRWFCRDCHDDVCFSCFAKPLSKKEAAAKEREQASAAAGAVASEAAVGAVATTTKSTTEEAEGAASEGADGSESKRPSSDVQSLLDFFAMIAQTHAPVAATEGGEEERELVAAAGEEEQDGVAATAASAASAASAAAAAAATSASSPLVQVLGRAELVAIAEKFGGGHLADSVLLIGRQREGGSTASSDGNNLNKNSASASRRLEKALRLAQSVASEASRVLAADLKPKLVRRSVVLKHSSARAVRAAATAAVATPSPLRLAGGAIFAPVSITVSTPSVYSLTALASPQDKQAANAYLAQAAANAEAALVNFLPQPPLPPPPPPLGVKEGETGSAADVDEVNEGEVGEEAEETDGDESTKLLQPTINIGLVGHVAHGKSSVVRYLSGKRTQQHSQEHKLHGATIKLGYANCKVCRCCDPSCASPGCFTTMSGDDDDDPMSETTTPACTSCGSATCVVRHVSFVDCPGHHDLISTMLSGTSAFDAALVVVAANEAVPAPQTASHLAILTELGFRKEQVCVLQNKAELLFGGGSGGGGGGSSGAGGAGRGGGEKDAMSLGLQKMSIHAEACRTFTAATSAEGAPLFPVSAQLGHNMDAVREEVVVVVVVNFHFLIATFLFFVMSCPPPPFDSCLCFLLSGGCVACRASRPRACCQGKCGAFCGGAFFRHQPCRGGRHGTGGGRGWWGAALRCTQAGRNHRTQTGTSHLCG